MTSVLFTIGGLVMNALTLNLLKFSLASLRIMVKKNVIDLTFEKLQSGRDEWNEDKMKRLDLINIKQGQSSKIMLMKRKLCLIKKIKKKDTNKNK